MSIADEARGQGALTVAEAARRLGVDGRQLVEDMYHRRIRFVMIGGIAHIPEDALEEFRSTSS
jgi:excisionase family DNA binding protein